MLRSFLKLRLKPCRRYYSARSRRATELKEPDTIVRLLCNGIRVATEQTCSPLACVSLFIETGPRYELACNNGVNHFIEHLAFKSHCTMSAEDIQAFAETTGSRLTAHTSQELQSFSVICTPEFIEHATNLLCGIVTQLRFDPWEMQCEAEKILMQMCDADRDYRTLVFDNLIQSAFQGTSLGQKVVGPSQNLQNFNESFLRTYMCAQYQPFRIVFSTSGAVATGYVPAIVDRQLSGVPVAWDPCHYTQGRFTGSSVIYRDDSRDFAHVAVAFEAPGFLSDNYLLMLLLKNMVGCWSKTHSSFGGWPDLAQRCADTELCHSCESFYLSYRDIGLWGIYFVCGKLEPEDFLHNWQDILMSISCHMRDPELERAKRVTKLELCQDRNGAINSSLTLGKEIMYRGKRPLLSEYIKAIDAVTTKELQQMAYNTFYNKMPVLSAAGPTENVPDYNRLSASQYWIRW